MYVIPQKQKIYVGWCNELQLIEFHVFTQFKSDTHQ